MIYAGLVGEDDFNSNARIFGEKASAIEEYLKDSELKLCNLDHEISLIRAKLDDLVSHEREVAERVTAHKAYIAPIRRIMPEILQEIFVHCIPTSHNAIMSSKEAPLLLGRICSYWRQVTFSTPALWSSLHICIPSLPPQTHTLHITTVINEWLHRSRNLPLSISISSCQEVLSKSLHRLSMQEIINVVVLFSSRWRRIYMKDSYYKWDDLFLKVKVENVPLLEELVLVGYGGPDTLKKAVALVKENKSMLSAPLLHRISLRPLGPNMKHYPIRWGILTALDLKGVICPYNEIINTLNQCPSLEICTLSIESSGDILDEEEETTACTDDKIILPRLCTLHLVPEYIIHAGNTIHFFRSLYAPQLRHLKIERVSDVFRRDTDIESYPQDSILLPTLSSFFATLEHGLEELCLRSLFLPSENIVIVLLKHLPLLRRLSLRLCLDGMIPAHRSSNDLRSEAPWDFDDSILDMFIAKPNNDGEENVMECASTDGDPRAAPSQCLCPHLEVLHCTGANFKPSSLLSFLRSRTLPVHSASSGDSRLREASISFIQGAELPGEEVRKEIEMLEINTGLSLDLWYYPSKRKNRSQYDISSWAFRPERNFSVYDGLGIEDEWSTNSGECQWSRFPVLQEQKRYTVEWA